MTEANNLDHDIDALRQEMGDEFGSILDRSAEGPVGHEGKGGLDLEVLKAAVTKSVEAEQGAELSLLQRFSQLPTSSRLGVVSMVFVAMSALPLLLKPEGKIVQKVGDGSQILYFGAVLVVFAVGIAAVRRLLRPLHQRVGSGPAAGLSSKVLLGLGMLLPLVLAIMPLDGGGHGGASIAGSAFALGCTKCLAFGALLGLPVLLVARAAKRHHLDEGAVGALAGVVMGLGGNVALHLHCPNTTVSHRLFGHALLALIVTVMAWWLHRRSTAALQR